MDQRYLRYLYFRRVSRREKRGFAYYEPWHPASVANGRSRKRGSERYKTIDRATIRKPAIVNARWAT